MEDQMKQRLTRRDVWVRLLYIVIFAIAWSIAEAVIGLVTLLQFLIVLLTGSANENLLRLGANLSAYAQQVFRYITFNTEEQPFPISDWPNVPVPEDNAWVGAQQADVAPADVPAAAPAGDTGPADTSEDPKP
tara:strand:- start:19933 stop:20331 length:399 start_codon:yes stop_codon:yes gene_type:complete